MIATTKIKMDLTGAGNMPWIDLMQNDSCSRNLQISLFAGATPFMIPEDCTALVRYSKPDGKGGVYDTLPDGTKAYSFSENRVTVTLAPQVSTAAGRVELTVSLLRAGAQLSCFSLQLMVHAQPGGKESERYVNVTAFLPQTGNAKVGQLLKVTETENGTVRAMETVAMPRALPNPKPLMVGGNCYDGSVAVEVPIPDAVRADVAQEAERVAEAACQRQGEGTLTFLVCSDAHHSLAHPNGTQLAESLNHGAQAMGLIRDKMHLDFFAMLGDVIWDAGETPRQAMAAMRYVNSLVAKCATALPNFRAVGNHDRLSSHSPALEDSQIYAGIGIFNRGADGATEGLRSGWFYRDFPESKIRVICLNTCESSGGSFALSQEQLNWLAGALELSSLGEGWGSILLSHHPLDWYGSSHAVVRTVAAAEHVLCAFHGHVHNYKVDTIAGTSVPRIAVPNLCFYRNNEYGQNGGAENSEGIEFGEETTYSKTAGTVEDTAFCVVTIDRAEGKVYADHYGAGYSRVVHLDGSAPQRHAVTYALEKVSAGNAVTCADHNASLAVRLTPEEGCKLESVKVSVGGVDMTELFLRGNTVEISCVTGDVQIRATAVADGGEEPPVPEEPEAAVDQVSTSIDADGSIYQGCGYLADHRLNSSGNTTALAGAVCSGFMAYRGQAITVVGSASENPSTLGNYITAYDGNFQKINSLGFDNLITYGAVWQQGEAGWQLHLDPGTLENLTAQEQLYGAAYIRCSLGSVSNASDLKVYFSAATELENVNWVLGAIDADGSLYQGCGYLENACLNAEGGTQAQTGAVVSGFVPYGGQVLRFGRAADGAVGYQGNFLGMYDAQFARINVIDFYNMANYGATWSETAGGYVLTVDPAALTNEYVRDQLASAAYIRCSLGYGKAEQFIITRNQPIL